MNVIIKPDGQMIVIAEHDRQALGGNVSRASHVIPENGVLRVMFRLLRMFGDDTPLANFTRGWRCRWIVDLRLSEGPIVGPFRSRQDAIDWEVRYLLRKYGGE